MHYDHREIEEKWQKKWKEANAFRADDTSPKEKKYILDMFPYPSGAGLHVGHVEGYTATDIYSRFLRMKGFEVLHPMGWDAFGLPAENYAIKTQVHPKITTEEAIKTFTHQIDSLGLSYDWSREIGTHRPEYYTWTQWFFLLFYKHGLAYKQKAKVNWCSKDQTVLANEQVVNGKCERCGTDVIQKDLEQWFFKITDYAEELLADLEGIDWPESTKSAQKNWIGKSEGAEIDFALKFEAPGDHTSAHITVFTTRPDTLYGATYVVLAPEHPWITLAVDENHTVVSNKAEVLAYVEKAKHKTDLERQETQKEKTGVQIEGVVAVNPATGEEIPLFVADYVFGSYGTGAIMAVPAHDERDAEFAKKFNLPVKVVIEGSSADEIMTGYGITSNSGDFSGISSEEAKEKITLSVGGKMKTTYRLRDWLISRQRYWGAPIPIIYCDECGVVPVPEKDLPVLLPDDVDFMPTGESPLAHSKSFQSVECPSCGKSARRESDTMDTFVCSSWYYFRFADPYNTDVFADAEKIKQWLPVDLYVGGAEHTVLHLLYSRFVTKVLHKLGYISFSEPFAKLRHQGTILAEDGRKMSKSLGNVVNPDDVTRQFGSDSIRLYEMFMGPLEVAKPWNTNNILGVRRFLEKVWGMQEKVAEHAMSGDTEILLHQTIAKVTRDIEELHFNTAVSQLMIFNNHLAPLEQIPKSAYETLLILLSPFAPHIADELWERLGNTEALSTVSWPRSDSAKAITDTVEIGVQVNGKVRGTIIVARGAAEEAVLEQARGQEGIAKWLSEGREVKAVYVPGRIVSFVVHPVRKNEDS